VENGTVVEELAVQGRAKRMKKKKKENKFCPTSWQDTFIFCFKVT
jgi:hypothetical protein